LGDLSIEKRLAMDANMLTAARQELVGLQLIAYKRCPSHLFVIVEFSDFFAYNCQIIHP
jgi:hypothetical protein